MSAGSERSQTLLHSSADLHAAADIPGDSLDMRTKHDGVMELAKYIRDEVWGTRDESDIVLDILGDSYHLHKIMLRRSSYFRSMFSSGWKESEEKKICVTLEDPDITSAHVRQALQYLYGFAPDLSDVVAVLGLWAAASFFGLETLQTRCFDTVLRDLNMDNVPAVLEFVDRRTFPKVEQIAAKAKSIVLRQAFSKPASLLKLPRRHLVFVLTNDALCVPDEYERVVLAETVLQELEKDSVSAVDGLTSSAASAPTVTKGTVPRKRRREGMSAGPSPLETSSCSLSETSDAHLSLPQIIYLHVLPTLRLASLTLQQLMLVRQHAMLPESLLASAALRRQCVQAYIQGILTRVEPDQCDKVRRCFVFDRPTAGASRKSEPFFAFGDIWCATCTIQTRDQITFLFVTVARRPPEQPRDASTFLEYSDPHSARKYSSSFALVTASGIVASQGRWSDSGGNSIRACVTTFVYDKLEDLLVDDRLYLTLAFAPDLS